MSRSKNNTIKTYGRHRQRVITADIWIRDEEKQADFGTGLFSSSDNGSLDSSDQNSTNNSLFAGQVTRSSKKTMRGKNKENAGKVHNRRVLRKRLASDGDSCSSTGSDSLFRSSRPRRALKDRNYNEQVSEKCGYGGKRKRVPKTVQTCQKSDSLSSVTNFSEFEDYSLVISGSPVQNSSPHTKGGIFSPHQLRSQSKIETSTPCAKRTCSANDINNLSVIDHVEEDISLSATDNLEQSSCAGKSLPRVCNVSEVSTTNKSVFRNSEDASHTSPVNTCLVQMEKLRQSVLSMHVSHRNSKQSNADFSDSLFSSFDEKSSSRSCVTAESKLESEENNEKDAETEEESEDDDLSKISEEENNEEEDKNVTKFMLVSPEIDNFYSAQSSLSSRGSPDVSVNKSPDVSVNKSLNKSHFEILTPQRQQSVPTVLPRSRVLEVCQQEDIETFQSCITSSMMRQCRKVGEGVYGEVFRTKRGQNSVALKIIPVEGDFEVNDEKQKTFEEILPEIVISVELSLLRDNEQCYTKNFCEVQRVSCVKGKYPSKLLTEWNTFHEEKGSENDNPVMFKENQLFIMFEFADGGKDLESAQLQRKLFNLSTEIFTGEMYWSRKQMLKLLTMSCWDSPFRWSLMEYKSAL
ncbi:uncharacterized protein LOC125659874 isoform X3 [Ostrea edulis]|uniref:uncharacterized protein LOC125659874 isoform X3 n=1 Tax=Ostrea edulis TaxID=37623 RepID=UPI0024AFCD99|nr:uncharacterized protein LOC125659874 isoform X3 [Ostrea edulis]